MSRRLDPANPDRYVYRGASEPMRIERETIRGQGRSAPRGGAAVHPARAGAARGPGPRPRLRAALGWRGAGRRRLPPVAGARHGPRLERLPRGGVRLEGAVREPGLRGRGREHRLDRRGPRAGAARLERPASRAGARREVRVERLPAAWPISRSRSTRRAASSPRPTTTSCRPGTGGRSGSSSARRSGSGGSSTCSATARRRDGGSRSPISSGCSTTSAPSCRLAVVAALRTAVAEGGASRRPGRAMTPIAGRPLAMLAAWDGTLSKDSAAAALYQAWLPKLKAAIAAAMARTVPARAPGPVDDRRPGAADAARARGPPRSGGRARSRGWTARRAAGAARCRPTRPPRNGRPSAPR